MISGQIRNLVLHRSNFLLGGQGSSWQFKNSILDCDKVESNSSYDIYSQYSNQSFYLWSSHTCENVFTVQINFAKLEQDCKISTVCLFALRLRMKLLQWQVTDTSLAFSFNIIIFVKSVKEIKAWKWYLVQWSFNRENPGVGSIIWERGWKVWYCWGWWRQRGWSI